MSNEKNTPTLYRYLPTPIGDLLLVGLADGTLTQIGLPEGKLSVALEDSWQEDDEAFPDAAQQFAEYFAGQRRDFDLTLSPQGTEFQRAVWKQLEKIPYGETISYVELASRVGKPTASRAVGAANGRNPLPIVVPCHRVIGANGSLVGFGGGLAAKKALLELEGALEQRSLLAS